MKKDKKSGNGGRQRAQNLSAERRKEIALKAATARWEGKESIPVDKLPVKRQLAKIWQEIDGIKISINKDSQGNV